MDFKSKTCDTLAISMTQASEAQRLHPHASNKLRCLVLILFSAFFLSHATAAQLRYVQQRTTNGVLEGVVAPMTKSAPSKAYPSPRLPSDHYAGSRRDP